MSIFDPVGPYALKNQNKPLSASRLSRWLIYTSSGDISTCSLKARGSISSESSSRSPKTVPSGHIKRRLDLDLNVNYSYHRYLIHLAVKSVQPLL